MMTSKERYHSRHPYRSSPPADSLCLLTRPLLNLPRARESTTRYLLNLPHTRESMSLVTQHLCRNTNVTCTSNANKKRYVKLPFWQTLSFSVYEKLRSCLAFPVVLAQAEVDTNNVQTVDKASQETERETKTSQETERETTASPETERETEKPLVTDDEVREYIAAETGEDRVRELFITNECGGTHPALMEILQVVIVSGLCGGMCGFVIGAWKGNVEFRERNRGSIFRKAYFYKSMLIDKAMLSGFRLGFKGLLFMGTFVPLLWTVAMSVSTYRNKTSFVEYSIAASLTSSLYRIHCGPKGMFAAAVIGLVFGTGAGLILMMTHKAFGETTESHHFEYTKEKLIQRRTYL